MIDLKHFTLVTCALPRDAHPGGRAAADGMAQVQDLAFFYLAFYEDSEMIIGS